MNKSIALGVLCLLAFAAAQSSTSVSGVPTPTSESEPWWKKELPKPIDLHPDVANKTHFFDWMKKHGKTFHANEVAHRYLQWKKSVHRVWELNQRTNSSWYAAINHMSAHTAEELRNMLGAKPAPQNLTRTTNTVKRFRPDWIDWSQRGAVTSVKDQGQCGSCWAFSAAGALEGAMAISGHGIFDLSSQQIIDCAGLGGCGGADPIWAMRWGGSNGMTSWNEYPYRASQGGCQGHSAHIHCNNVETSSSGNDEDAANIIAGGPTSICFNVVDDFFHYGGGVFDEYCPHGCAHAVTAVGYAPNCNNSGKDCYIIKNQWGTGWGTGGYFLMLRGNDMCGIADYLGRPDQCW